MTSKAWETWPGTVVVTGVSRDFLENVARTGRDELGQPVVRFVSEGGGEPLRDVLRRAKPGESVVLGSHSLYAQSGPFREFGPVYVSAQLVQQPPGLDELLAGDYFREEILLRRYDARGWISSARRMAKCEALAAVEEWLQRRDTAFVDARFPLYGCFACRFQREESPALPP